MSKPHGENRSNWLVGLVGVIVSKPDLSVTHDCTPIRTHNPTPLRNHNPTYNPTRNPSYACPPPIHALWPHSNEWRKLETLNMKGTACTTKVYVVTWLDAQNT